MDSQTEVIACLGSPATHGGRPVERVETHASIVFLAGARAYKLKRAVTYDYLDFSTPERRRAFCEAELRINGRAAPGLYRRVVPVTREVDGTLMLDGAGIPVEWVLEMARFDQGCLLDRLAAAARLDAGLMRPLGAAIAAFHAGADRRDDHGGASGMTWVLEGNAAACRDDALRGLDETLCRSVVSTSRRVLERHRALLDRRRDLGFVRQCHGDLHLGNLVLLDGRPTLFDAIEFNDELACVDVLYDLAFLLMDLWHRGLSRHGNAVLNGYLAHNADFDGLALLPLFLSARAAIRAKTSVSAARLSSDAARRESLVGAGRAYLRTAAQLLAPPQPSLVAIGGISGTGKSTLAQSLAPGLGPVPGAIVLRSDEIRKRLCGVPELSRLGPQGYTPEVSRAVYDTLASHAAAVVRAGHAAVVDAVFLDPADRTALGQAARAAGVPFVGLWLQAPEPVLVERVQRRSGDASDADAGIIRMQAARDPGTITWHPVDASIDPESLRQHAFGIVENIVQGGVTRAA